MTASGVGTSSPAVGFRFVMDVHSKVQVLLMDGKGQPLRAFPLRPGAEKVALTGINVRA